jgi:hypothetical protein
MTTTHELEPPPGSQLEPCTALAGTWLRTWPAHAVAMLLILLLLVFTFDREPRDGSGLTQQRNQDVSQRGKFQLRQLIG